MPGKYLTFDQRMFIIKKDQEGICQDCIAEEFKRTFQRKISRSTVSKTLTRYKRRGSLEDQEKSGAPAIYNPREKRKIIKASLAEPEKSIRDLSKNESINPKKAGKSTLNNLLLMLRFFFKGTFSIIC